jgi:hypothetical protein
MKIIKKNQPEQLNELFGRKKKQEEPVEPEVHPINREWDQHYRTLEMLRKSGVSKELAGSYFVADSGLPEDLAREIFRSWLDNYDELAFKLRWDKNRNGK